MASAWIATVCALVVVLHTAHALQPIPQFTLNLDLPPEQRWNGAVKQIVELYGWDNSFASVIDLYVPLFLLFPANVSSGISQHLLTYYPDVHGELTGIGQQLADFGCTICNTTFVYALAYFYELSHVSSFQSKIPPSLRRSCTGILSLPTNKSADILHGRNMDESPHSGRNMTLDIRVVKGGVHQYNMIDWTWITAGIATTSRKGGVTMEMNWNNDLPELSLEEIMDRILNASTVPVLQSFRIINDAEMDFDSAVNFIMTSQFASPYYNIVSGTRRRGAVLTIEFSKANNVVQYLNDSATVPFMVQTNYDRWLPDPTNDPRRTVAENTLKMEGPERSGSELGLWMALSVYPVHNKGTMFTALMSVAKDPEAYVRTSMVPEQQW